MYNFYRVKKETKVALDRKETLACRYSSTLSCDHDTSVIAVVNYELQHFLQNNSPSNLYSET